MHDNNDYKRWALEAIIASAHKKSQVLSEEQSLRELIEIIADATQKLSNIRWTDHQGMYYGTKIYLQAIENL
jgi:hypothetical protein